MQSYVTSLTVKSERQSTLSKSKARRLSARSAFCRLLSGALIAAIFPIFTVTAQTLPGTLIQNVANVSFESANGNPNSALSNAVDITTELAPTDAMIDFIKVAGVGAGGNSEVINTTGCMANGVSTILPAAELIDGSTVSAGNNYEFSENALYHVGEPLFFRVEDQDQNLDAATVDTIDVSIEFPNTGDEEQLTLSETDLNTGVFIGYVSTALPPATTNDCVLQVQSEGQAIVRYVDPNDGSDVVASNALVDPLGIVFDSGTGQPIDGAEVTIIDVSTGLPAMVFGDDGVSTYPAQVISGGVATDSSGVNYQFSPGHFRFPLVFPGTYRLQVVPPTGYAGPSTVPLGDLQQLPGAPFELVPASFGDVFVVNPGPVIRVDIPLDPSSAELFLQKTTPTVVAASGDFVQYNLRLDNANNISAIGDVRITDRLPPGFRFVAGSAVIDNASAADPVIDADGRTLTFLLGRMGAAESRRISYVTEVTAAVEGKEAINTAIASGAGAVQSNMASVTIRLEEDLFASNSILIGRVIVGSCDADVSNDETGLKNARSYLEDGRYAVTDEGGRFHFEGLDPGAHVVQLDVDSLPRHLEVMPCQNNSRFAGRSFSQFVDLRPGALWRADFHVQEIPPANGAVELTLSSQPRGDEVDYTIDIVGHGDVRLAQVRAMVLLPESSEYVVSSATLNAQSIANPNVAGPTLTFALGDRSGSWQEQLQFTTRLLPGGSREQVSKAMALFNSPTKKKQRTPLVENVLVFEPPKNERAEWRLSPRFDTRSSNLSASDKEKIDQIIAQLQGGQQIRVLSVGHTDNVQIAPQNRVEFADNYVLSKDRASKVAEYLRAQLNLPPSQITVDGKGSDEPIADNTSENGRALNRRVELMVWGEQASDQVRSFIPEQSQLASETKLAEVQGKSLKAFDQEDVEEHSQLNNYADPDWVQRVQPGIELLMPEEGANLAVPSLKVAVKHAHGQKVIVSLNGSPISGIHYDGITRTQDKKVAISRWRGANLVPGDNLLKISVTDRQGIELERITRNVHFSGGPVRGKLNASASTLIADGRQKPMIVLDMVDRENYPARPDSIGVYHVDEPYRAQWEVDAARENQLVVVGDRDPVYRVNDQGQAVIELEPTSQAGEVVINLEYENNRSQEIRAWLKPAARNWILVALAEGTAGLNDIKDNLQNAQDDGLEQDYYDDGRVAFFAKGRVRGEFLLSLAYDSKGDQEKDQERLFGTIDPDRFYTLYGDATEQRFDAASQERLFVKLERNQFYALFGDYQTALTVNELSRYNRSMNGFKSEYSGQMFSYNVFASNTNQSFIKDELLGDGTSGLYRLTRQSIVINSEKVTIEVRDRLRTERVLESRTLARHLDYNIDYLQGTLYFKQPVTSRDQQLNPVYIVVDYESRDQSSEELIAGGRAAVTLGGDRVEVGVSGIHEGMTGGDGELYGADLKVELRPGTELRAEWATSESFQNGLASEGDAYLVELKHQSERLEGSLYTREQESGFGLGQQRGTESGTQKTGMHLRMRMSSRLSLIGDAYQQENLGTSSTRTVAQGEVRYQSTRGSVGVGVRSAVDEDINGSESESEQFFINASLQALNNRMTLRGSTEFSANGSDANGDFPRRTILGLDYRLNDRYIVFAEHEIADGESIEAQTTRAGVRVTPWERAKIDASVNQQTSEYGPRVFANVGLVQGFQVNEKLTIDAGVDHGNTVKQPDFNEFDADTPNTSGGVAEDFTAVFLGALYRSDEWSATSRFEYRNSDAEKRQTLLFGLYREENQGKGFSLSSQIFNSSAVTGLETLNADVRMGWSYRPDDSRWVFFDRLDLVYKDVQSSSADSQTWKVVNNFNASWMYSRDLQFDFQYGAKFVRSDIANTSYTGFSDLIGASFRKDIGRRWDIGMHGHVRHSWNADVYDYSLGIEAGTSLAKNTWIGLGYNFSGFEDDDFSQAGYLAHGPYLRFRIKADQHSLNDLRQGMFFRRDDEAALTSRRRPHLSSTKK